MQISIEKSDGLAQRLSVEVPYDEIGKKIKNRLKELVKTVEIKGYRKGKVPMKFIEKQYKAGVQNEVLTKVISDSFLEAVKQENIEPAGQPEIKIDSFADQQPLKYTATFETMPEIKISDLETVEFEQLDCEVTESDIEKMMERVRKNYAKWILVEREAKEGDKLTINFDGFVDEKPLEGGKAEKFSVIIGSKQMIPGFEEGLIGAKTGEDLTLNLTFPDPYHQQDIAGKPVRFEIKVIEVYEPKLPELNEDFFKSIRIDGGIDEFKQKMRERLETEAQRLLIVHNKAALLDQLIMSHQFDIPKTLVKNEAIQLWHIQHQYHPHYEEAVKSLRVENLPKRLLEEAEKRVARSLFLAEMVKRYHIELDKEKVQKTLAEMVKDRPNPESVLKWYAADPKRMQPVESLVVENQVVEKLLDSVQVKTKTVAGYYQFIEQLKKEGQENAS